MAIARFPTLVIDCPDPAVLAAFYGTLLDWESKVSPDWAEIRAEYGQAICFQQVANYTEPKWPTQEVPQQMHIDVLVDDLDTGEAAVLELGMSSSRAPRSGSSSTPPGTRSASPGTERHRPSTHRGGQPER
jgi:hypothetical protein